MESARADLHIVRLQDQAPLLGPIALQAEYQLLERAGCCADLHASTCQWAWGPSGAREYSEHLPRLAPRQPQLPQLIDPADSFAVPYVPQVHSLPNIEDQFRPINRE